MPVGILDYLTQFKAILEIMIKALIENLCTTRLLEGGLSSES